MKKLIKQVTEFNEAFNVPVNTQPQLLPNERHLLRFKLLKEEIDEYFTAAAEKDLKEILDALCDIQYILTGTVIEHGLQNVFEAAFNEVHRSNMAKLEGGTIRDDGKIMKPEGWKPPNLEQFVK